MRQGAGERRSEPLQLFNYSGQPFLAVQLDQPLFLRRWRERALQLWMLNRFAARHPNTPVGEFHVGHEARNSAKIQRGSCRDG